MSIQKPKSVAGIIIPDSTIALQATELLLEHGNEFLYNHSLRVFLFAAMKGKRLEAKYDTELLYFNESFEIINVIYKGE